MNDPLDPLTEELSRLTAAIAPGERRRMAREIAADIRRANAQRIRANITPDGEPMAPRKPRTPRLRGPSLRERASAAAARRGRMFRKAPGKLRMQADPGGAEVGFPGRTGRIMAVHQHGLRDRVSADQTAAEVNYPARAVLGLSAEDRVRINTVVQDAISPT